jgi:hypothetical protein
LPGQPSGCSEGADGLEELRAMPQA